MFNTLGLIYHVGKSIIQDYTKANAYFEKARQEGYAAASRNLGMNYYRSDGVERNYAKTLELFKEAEARLSTAKVIEPKVAQ
jgi:TPR repeat protein